MPVCNLFTRVSAVTTNNYSKHSDKTTTERLGRGWRLFAHQLLEFGALIAVSRCSEHVAAAVLWRIVQIRDFAFERQQQAGVVHRGLEQHVHLVAFAAVRLGVELLGRGR